MEDGFKDYENENEKKDLISKLSNDIIDGTHGILFFNGVSSLIFCNIFIFF